MYRIFEDTETSTLNGLRMHQTRDYPSSPLIPEEEEDDDRHNRFLGQSHEATLSLRERAASQPPKSSDQPFPSPAQQFVIPSSLGRTSAASWIGSQRRRGLPIASGGRSSSFSSNAQVGYGNSLRDSFAFESTFEDDESALDAYDDSRYMMPQQIRGRTYADPSRSRSQSLATPISRPMPSGGSPYIGSPPGLSSWKDSVLSNTNPLNIPGRYGEIKPPGTSRYGSLGALGRSPVNGSSPLSSFHRHQIDPSNQSPFVRDVGHNDMRDLWAGMNPPKDEVGGGGSGTTSRRHSVSIVPRRANVVGFNAPEDDVEEPSSRQPVFTSAFGRGGSGLMLSDDDLASDLNSMSIGPTSSYQDSSRLSFSRQSSGYSPPRQYDQSEFELPKLRTDTASRYMTSQHVPQQQNGFNITSPTSPSVARNPYFGQQPQQAARRPSDAPQPPSSLADIGKGVPLHSVPPTWPLFIVEFKAGRTDLFYLTDLSQDIHIGDLVLVEADRGKDLGKVVNDTITLLEVEEFQRRQVAKSAAEAAVVGNEPTSPTSGAPPGTGSAKKEINPKMIYGKATSHDIQMLHSKMADEAKALQLCQSKVEAKKLPMQVIDAEYQWDRRKLTFYFIAEKRIDFRELVRELFRLYKTRIWMASLQGPGMSYES